MGHIERSTRLSQSGRLFCCVAIGSLAWAAPSDAQDAQVEQAEIEEPSIPDVTQDASPSQEEIDSERAALASELASAERFEVELNGLLLPNGQLNTSRPNALPKLRSLATRCGILANSAMHDEVRLVLLGYQARALSALSSQNPGDEGEDTGWIEQLNDTAQQIAAIGLPGAAATADYWLLIGEISQHTLSSLPPTQRQARIEQTLRVFIEKHADDPQANEYLLDARLVLARLMNQRGAQREVKTILKQLGDLPENSPRLGEVNRLNEIVDRLGTPIEFESVSTQLTRWRASDHAGKPLLIHVYADSVEPSVHMIDVISRSIVEGSLRGIAVVSLRIGEPIAGTNTPPWPTLPVELKADGVLGLLGVTALPTLAWVDETGKLAAIGTTSAVLDQLENIVPNPLEQENASAVGDDPAIQAETDDPSNPDAEATPDEPADASEHEAEGFPF